MKHKCATWRQWVKYLSNVPVLNHPSQPQLQGCSHKVWLIFTLLLLINAYWMCKGKLCRQESNKVMDYCIRVQFTGLCLAVCWRHCDVNVTTSSFRYDVPDNKVHEANMGPIWGRQVPGGPHVGPMILAIWGTILLGMTVLVLWNWEANHYIFPFTKWLHLFQLL